MFQEEKELTVTEVKHPCPPTWRKRIDDAEARGYFTSREKVLAASWGMCAVGEAIDRYNIAVTYPVDSVLLMLGVDFLDVVSCSDFDSCRQILTQIEQRLSEIGGLQNE